MDKDKSEGLIGRKQLTYLQPETDSMKKKHFNGA